VPSRIIVTFPYAAQLPNGSLPKRKPLHPGSFAPSPSGESRPISSTRQESPQRSLHPLAWAGIVGGGLIGIAILVLLGVQLAVLRDSQRHIRSQDAKLTAAYKSAREASGGVRPLLREAAPVARQARRALGTVNSLPPVLQAAATLVDTSLPLVRTLSAVGTPDVVANANDLLARVAASDLVAKAARAADLAPTLIDFQQRLLRIQAATLRSQRESLRTQQTTLEIQRQALSHIESIDRKTGGQAPPVPVVSP
jgi:hypothetical protein